MKKLPFYSLPNNTMVEQSFLNHTLNFHSQFFYEQFSIHTCRLKTVFLHIWSPQERIRTKKKKRFSMISKLGMSNFTQVANRIKAKKRF